MTRPDDATERRAHPHHWRPHPAPLQPDPADPVDPDLLPISTPVAGRPARVIPTVAAGGMLGSLARYQAVLWWPPVAGRFDLTTALINAIGCVVIGVVATVISDLRDSHPLARPFWVTGVLGGFTTLSAYAVGGEQLLAGGHPLLAVLTILGTALAAVGGCAAARMLTLHLHHRFTESAPAPDPGDLYTGGGAAPDPGAVAGPSDETRQE